MKKLTALALCFALALSLSGCGKQEDVEIPLDDLCNIIQNHFEIYGKGDNCIGYHIDREENVVVIEMKDVSAERQDEFIHDTFSKHTGSNYIKYIREHDVLRFEAPS